jgi:hypothetical protein
LGDLQNLQLNVFVVNITDMPRLITFSKNIYQCKHFILTWLRRFTCNTGHLRRSQISVASIAINTIALWLGGDFNRPANAMLYGTLTDYLKTAANNFCLSGGLDAKGTAAINSLIDLIPWSAILLIGSIVAWEAYRGYQAYQREDATGMGRVVVNLFTTVVLILITDLLTAYVTTAPGPTTTVPGSP